MSELKTLASQFPTEGAVVLFVIQMTVGLFLKLPYDIADKLNAELKKFSVMRYWRRSVLWPFFIIGRNVGVNSLFIFYILACLLFAVSSGFYADAIRIEVDKSEPNSVAITALAMLVSIEALFIFIAICLAYMYRKTLDIANRESLEN